MQLRILWVVVLALAASALAGCGGTSAAACQAQAKTYAEQVQPLTAEWQDGIKLAANAPRMSLAPQIASLQAIRRKADALTVPECAKAAHTKLTHSMDTAIDGFLAFLGQEPETKVNQKFADAGREMDEFSLELTRITSGIPATEVPSQAIGRALAVGHKNAAGTYSTVVELFDRPSGEAGAQVVTSIHEGDSVEILERRGGDAWVRAYTGTVGWTKAEYLKE